MKFFTSVSTTLARMLGRKQHTTSHTQIISSLLVISIGSTSFLHYKYNTGARIRQAILGKKLCEKSHNFLLDKILQSWYNIKYRASRVFLRPMTRGSKEKEDLVLFNDLDVIVGMLPFPEIERGHACLFVKDDPLHLF